MKIKDLKNILVDNTYIKIVNDNLEIEFMAEFKDAFDCKDIMNSNIYHMWTINYKNESQLVIQIEN